MYIIRTQDRKTDAPAEWMNYDKEGYPLATTLNVAADYYDSADASFPDHRIQVIYADPDTGTCMDFTNEVMDFIFAREDAEAADAILDYQHERQERAQVMA